MERSDTTCVGEETVTRSSTLATSIWHSLEISGRKTIRPPPRTVQFALVSIPGQILPTSFGSRTHLLEVTPEVVYRRERELVLVGVAQLLVVRHQLVFVQQLVRNVEEQSVLEGALRPALAGFLGLKACGFAKSARFGYGVASPSSQPCRLARRVRAAEFGENLIGDWSE